MSAHLSRMGRLAAVTSAAVVLACTGIGVGTASAAQSHEVGYSAHGHGADAGWGHGDHDDGGGWGHGDGGY